jgi:hypothetical protein
MATTPTADRSASLLVCERRLLRNWSVLEAWLAEIAQSCMNTHFQNGGLYSMVGHIQHPKSCRTATFENYLTERICFLVEIQSVVEAPSAPLAEVKRDITHP